MGDAKKGICLKARTAHGCFHTPGAVLHEKLSKHFLKSFSNSWHAFIKNNNIKKFREQRLQV